MTVHEFKISYLAYLWKNNYVSNHNGVFEIRDEKKLGMDMYVDFELYFEDLPEKRCGVNLNITYNLYQLNKLENLIQFKSDLLYSCFKN